MADVFISYARADRDFVLKLHEALGRIDRATWVDWIGIPPTAEWLKEVFLGIESADNFVFVISPESVASEVCQREIAHAVANNKRLIPILRHPVSGNLIPESLSRIQYLFFRDTDDFEIAFSSLVEALDADLDWKRLQTRFLLRARDWGSHDHDASFVLRGKDLQEAEEWSTKNLGSGEMRRDGAEDISTNAPHDIPQATANSEVLFSASTGVIGDLVRASIQVRDEELKAAEEADRAVHSVKVQATELEGKKAKASRTVSLFALIAPATALFVSGHVEYLSGKGSPYAILAIVLLSLGLGAFYLEGGSAFGDGGTFTTLNSAVGLRIASLSMYGLLFDTLLLGGIVLTTSAAYLLDITHGLIPAANQPLFLVAFAITATAAFWLKRALDLDIQFPRWLRGITWSAGILCSLWGFATLFRIGAMFPPVGTSNLQHSFGWSSFASFPGIGAMLLLAPVAASMLVLSDDEAVKQFRQRAVTGSLSQIRWNIVEAIAARFCLPVFVCFTTVMVIPDRVRPFYRDAPVTGLIMNLWGPYLIRLVASIIVGILAIGSLLALYNATILRPDGIFGEAAKAGIFGRYFGGIESHRPNKVRLINLLMALQVLAILACRGDIQNLTNAYALGIGLSYILRGVSLLRNRGRDGTSPQWKFPLNFAVAGRLIPAGLICVTAVTVVLTIVALLSRRTTIYALLFMCICFVAFQVLPTFRRIVTESSPPEPGQAD